MSTYIHNSDAEFLRSRFDCVQRQRSQDLFAHNEETRRLRAANVDLANQLNVQVRCSQINSRQLEGQRDVIGKQNVRIANLEHELKDANTQLREAGRELGVQDARLAELNRHIQQRCLPSVGWGDVVTRD